MQQSAVGVQADTKKNEIWTVEGKPSKRSERLPHEAVVGRSEFYTLSKAIRFFVIARQAVHDISGEETVIPKGQAGA